MTNKLKAVIFVAGKGDRLLPYSLSQHKCLFDIHGKPLIWYSINNLLSVGVKEISLIVGYKAQSIKTCVSALFPGQSIRYIYNPKYDTASCIYSYYVATDFFIRHNYFRLVGDIVYSKNILTYLMNSCKPIVSAVKKKRKILKDEYCVTVNTKTETVLRFGTDIPASKSFGEAKGIEYITSSQSVLVARFIRDLIDKNQINKFGEYVYQYMINMGKSIYYEKLRENDNWFELDTIKDYNTIKKHFNRKHSI